LPDLILRHLLGATDLENILLLGRDETPVVLRKHGLVEHQLSALRSVLEDGHPLASARKWIAGAVENLRARRRPVRCNQNMSSHRLASARVGAIEVLVTDEEMRELPRQAWIQAAAVRAARPAKQARASWESRPDQCHSMKKSTVSVCNMWS
jgi:hypothetical protein